MGKRSGGSMSEHCNKQHATSHMGWPFPSIHRAHRLLSLGFSMVIGVLTPSAVADTPGEARFFKDCPQRHALHLHEERNPWDLHALLYTTLGLSEVEFLRMADGLVDLPLPGHALHPFRRAVVAIRAGYDQLPPWRLRQRVGEFVDALQLPELSLGDATATYSVATGGITGPGSGMMVRLSKLIDWTQHVTGDLNQLSGRLIGRPRGLITWMLPEQAVDGAQWLLIKTFHHLSVLMARSVDHGLTGVEMTGDAFLNVGRRRPHQETTVFLRLPIEVYRAHELWILEHRTHLVVGPPALFLHSSHAALAHHPQTMLSDWSLIDQPNHEEPVLIVMTTVRVMSRAPESLTPYVVPAAWVLNEAQTIREVTGER